MIKVQIKNINDFHFEGTDANGKTVNMDAPVNGIGGENGIRPMQMLLMGLGGCSGIDVVSILKKQKQEFSDFSINIEAEREKDKEPALFTKIHAHFIFTGDLDPTKVERAVDLSITKYCSVARTLEKTAEITYSFEIK